MKSAFAVSTKGNNQTFAAHLDPLLSMFQSGLLNIRHALLLYNDCISQLCRTGRESDDLYLHSFEQLADQFKDVRDMIYYLKHLFREEQTEYQHVFMQPGRSNTFSAMLKYINGHFSEDITILGLSNQFNFHPKYISQLFRKELDKTFTEYLTGLRMNRASVLIRSTSLPINEIADQVGCKDYFSFSKLFKKTMGLSPRTYRNAKNENGILSDS